jgi:succinate dehydrogenase flavin-adding protein (antitoxin of CptAB toxin-antitoxin module)
LEILAFDPSDIRKAGVLARLTEHHYQTFKELIQKTDETLVQLRENRQQNQQKLMEQLRSLSVDQLSSVGINPEWLN